MIESFNPFLDILSRVHDPRRGEGKRYVLCCVLLFVILAIVAGADSYRDIHTFMKVHWPVLRHVFGLKRKKPPAHTTIRDILIGLDEHNVEDVFRQHAAALNADKLKIKSGRVLALDGKVLKNSFDGLANVRAKQIFSAFASGTNLVLAHIEIDEKSNEIPAAQKLLETLGITDHIITLDAIHCQKKPSRLRPGSGRT